MPEAIAIYVFEVAAHDLRQCALRRDPRYARSYRARHMRFGILRNDVKGFPVIEIDPIHPHQPAVSFDGGHLSPGRYGLDVLQEVAGKEKAEKVALLSDYRRAVIELLMEQLQLPHIHDF